MDEYIDRKALIEHLEKDPLYDLVEQYGVTGVIESFPAADVQPVKWIPVAERLPEQNTRVIGFMAWKGITAIEYQHGKWYSIDHLQSLPNEAVTHWMPLPEPPKDGKT